MKLPAFLNVMKSNTPVDIWRLATWSFSISFLACSFLLIGSAFTLHWIFLSISLVGGISFLVSFFVFRNALVSMGADRKQLDAIWKQSAFSLGAIALVALPIYLLLMVIAIGITKLIGYGFTETNALILAIVIAVSCLCLLASAFVGWRFLGRKVFDKYTYTPSMNVS